jgi:5-methylthioribose kinase
MRDGLQPILARRLVRQLVNAWFERHCLKSAICPAIVEGMRLLDASNIEEYLRSTGRLAADEGVRVETLAGGVSNAVLRVEPEGGTPFVIKQAREQLRTEASWFSRLDRIWRETAAMGAIRPLLPAGAVPRILFEDRDNYLFAMDAVDARHIVWKKELLAGRIRPEVALRLADYLATIHRGTHGNAQVARQFDDRQIFVELRVDPFYRHIARVHPEIAGPSDALVDEMWRTRACLVHADFSPKNVLLVDSAQGGPEIKLVDFETAHYGDPAFDLGFFLSHLMLKGVRAGRGADAYLQLARAFWENYSLAIRSLTTQRGFAPADLERRAVSHLAGCALARVDGTSPVDYLPHTWQRELVRSVCLRVMTEKIQQLAAIHSLVTSSARKES